MGIPMPVASMVRELFQMARQGGNGDVGFSALARFLENRR